MLKYIKEVTAICSPHNVNNKITSTSIVKRLQKDMKQKKEGILHVKTKSQTLTTAFAQLVKDCFNEVCQTYCRLG